MDNSSNENAGLTQSTIIGEVTTNDRMNDPYTPGKVPEDPYDSFIQKYAENKEIYGNFGDCVPDSKVAGGNLAKIQENIRDRFNLDPQDGFGDDYSADKKLY